MKKGIKFLVNLVVFAIIIGFGWYIFATLGKGERKTENGGTNIEQNEISAYKKINSFQVDGEIITFDLSGDKIYMAENQSIMIYDMAGTLIAEIPTGKEIRDIKVDDNRIYLLHPAEIEVFTPTGERVNSWPARRPGSDYCSMALSKEFIFATDAGNKNICKYTKEGDYLDIIISPLGFIIPSYAFDIINIRDTMYCSNSGRHQIESYTLEGKFITAFGKTGTEAGSFLGCCNPNYLAATQHGDILTSEKGIPRISCFSKDGQFRTILLNSKALGGGTQAYKIKAQDDRIFVAGKNSISIYVFDSELAVQSSCAGCTVDCPLKNRV